MRISLGVLALSLFLGLAFGSSAPFTTSYAFNGPHAYDIHWVTNSGTVFLLTNDGTGTHKLFRSDNLGVRFTEQVLVNPTGCYVVRIYEDPMNPQHLIFMGPPAGSCGWTTTDAGNTYNYVTIPGLQSISFNPNVSGLALGRTADSRVYLTRDGGNTWNQINATRAAWAPRPVVSGTGFSGNLYLIKNNVLGYSEDEGQTFIPIFDQMNEVHATSNYVYATAVNRSLIVGQNLENIQRAYFPFGETVPYVYSVSDDTSGATFFYTDASAYWGNIYTASGTSGALYVEVLQHVLKRDDATLDIHSIHGLPGVHIANVVQNFNDYHDLQLKTYITFNNGGDWSPLAPPAGQFCINCNLNLYFNYKTDQRAMYTSSHTIGLLIANGYVASAMSYDNPIGLTPFISRNAGLTWDALSVNPAGPYIYEFGQNGGILVLAPENQLTSTIYYSFDQGKTIQSFTLSASVYVTRISTQSGGASSIFVLFTINTQGSGTVYTVDFSPFNLPACTSSDYETWAPSDGSSVGCWLGQTITYSRRKPAAACNDTRGELIVSSAVCTCTLEDYECDFGFAPGIAGTCTVSGNLPPSPPAICIGTYEKSQGFRLVPGDKCQGGVDKRPEILDCPTPPNDNPSKGSSAWVPIVVVLVVLIVVGLIAFIIYRDPVMKEKIVSLFRPSRSSRYGRVGGRGRSSSLVNDEDFGIHDDLLEEGGEEDAKVLHDNDITRATSKSEEGLNVRHTDED